jgi:3-methyladenine DNA glycosylase Tag
MMELAEAHGGFGAYLAEWPERGIVELWHDLAKRFSQLGGNSAPYFLRMAGKDTFVLSPDVVAALNRLGAFDGAPKSKRDKARVQDAFNRWHEETGRPLSQISMILALSAG